MAIASISSPTFTTSVTFSTLFISNCDIWINPSQPGHSSTNAPKSSTETTLQLYILPNSTSLAIFLILSAVALIISESVWYIITLPSSSKSTLTALISFTVLTWLHSRIILVIISPPRPITSLILSGLIIKVIVLGAYLDTSLLGLDICFSMTSNIWNLAFLACSKASFNIFLFIPSILISIWRAVIPSRVPATLKSISPKWSSIPWISVRIVYSFSWVISPMAIPATGFLIGTPAAIKAIVPAHIVAWLLEPLLSSISLTTLMVYGNSSSLGIT